jgi:Zn-dependent protease
MISAIYNLNNTITFGRFEKREMHPFSIYDPYRQSTFPLEISLLERKRNFLPHAYVGKYFCRPNSNKVVCISS